jgi:muramoyltetrapeptide carboxypeptidase
MAAMEKTDNQPKLLKQGDTIGVAAPAGPFEPSVFEAGVEVLEDMGFQVAVDPVIHSSDRFMAGSDLDRIGVLHRLYADPDIQAIICARGGYGSMRLLPLLDLHLVTHNPKPLIGFSDISALTNVIAEHCRVCSIHGPVVTSLGRGDDVSHEALYAVLTGSGDLTVRAPRPICIHPGTATGPLMGGNLTTLCHLLGTGYMPSFKGCVLLLEDINEPPYRLDRMLVQMLMAGCFEGIAGIILGSFVNCGAPNDIITIFEDIFREAPVPISFGFPIGHGPTNLAVPIGRPARFDADAGEFTVPAAGERRP